MAGPRGGLRQLARCAGARLLGHGLVCGQACSGSATVSSVLQWHVDITPQWPCTGTYTYTICTRSPCENL